MVLTWHHKNSGMGSLSSAPTPIIQYCIRGLSSGRQYKNRFITNAILTAVVKENPTTFANVMRRNIKLSFWVIVKLIAAYRTEMNSYDNTTASPRPASPSPPSNHDTQMRLTRPSSIIEFSLCCLRRQFYSPRSWPSTRTHLHLRLGLWLRNLICNRLRPNLMSVYVP